MNLGLRVKVQIAIGGCCRRLSLGMGDSLPVLLRKPPDVTFGIGCHLRFALSAPSMWRVTEKLFALACENNLDGIVTKHRFGPYLQEEAQWIRIRNQKYSQWEATVRRIPQPEFLLVSTWCLYTAEICSI